MTNSQRLATVRAHLQQWLAANVMPRPCQMTPDVDASNVVSEAEVSEGAELNADCDLDQASETDATESAEATQEQMAQEIQSQSDQEDENDAKIVSESILIRDGFYAGRTFHATAQGETFRATWFMEPDELKIHGAGGALVASFQGEQIVANAPALQDVALEDVALEDAASDDQDESSATDAGPISFPMPAADHDSSDQDSDQQGQVPKAA
ncbi:hypothetical protein NZK35_21200 [Stieleria sp. ICT_E10.1]|uniref:hypothetical protein n=1 Tax=Stieleria sedimenti TaxID=2976331 RepID=UPI002180841E|nr:hypothetical protein [Stieleria sedimenti]MCS7469178.1 hypothetical protein [Stieleria sedimenti]